MRRQLKPLKSNKALSERISGTLSWSIFVGVVALIVMTAVPHGTVDPWWESRFQCAVFALAALWVLEGLVGGSWSVNRYYLLLPLIALVIFAYFQTLPLWGEQEQTPTLSWRTVSADPFETFRFTIRLASLTVVTALLMSYTSTRSRLYWLVHSIIAVGVASALYGIVRQTAQHSETSIMFAYLMPGEGYAQFVNANHFAFLMEMALGLTLGIVVAGGVSRNRVLLYLAAVIPLFAALVLCNSRGGILAILGQVLFLALCFGAVRSRFGSQQQTNGLADVLSRLSRTLVARSLLAACLLLVLGFCIVLIGGDPLADRLETLDRETGVANANPGGVRRVEIWSATWQLIKAYPVAGIGFGGYWIAIPEYHRASGEETPQEAHNDYLELLASGGMIGVALVAVFIALLLRVSLQQLRARDSFRRAACFGALAGIFGVAVHSLVDFGLHVTANAVVFCVLIVIASRDVYGENEVLRQRSNNRQLVPPGPAHTKKY